MLHETVDKSELGSGDLDDEHAERVPEDAVGLVVEAVPDRRPGHTPAGSLRGRMGVGPLPNVLWFKPGTS